MFETILTVALLSGAQQVDNTVVLDKDVIIRVQEKTGYNVFLIEDNAHYKVKKSQSTFVLELIGQDHNGAE